MITDTFTQWFVKWGLSEVNAEMLGVFCAFIFLIFLALTANYTAKAFINWVIHPLIHKTSIAWDDLLIEKRVIVRFSHIVPAAVIHFFAPSLFSNFPEVSDNFSIV
ncbi:MAG: hypothetical protein ABF325_11655, partial [Lentimonas sp.]